MKITIRFDDIADVKEKLAEALSGAGFLRKERASSGIGLGTPIIQPYQAPIRKAQVQLAEQQGREPEPIKSFLIESTEDSITIELSDNAGIPIVKKILSEAHAVMTT